MCVWYIACCSFILVDKKIVKIKKEIASFRIVYKCIEVYVVYTLRGLKKKVVENNNKKYIIIRKAEQFFFVFYCDPIVIIYYENGARVMYCFYILNDNKGIIV